MSTPTAESPEAMIDAAEDAAWDVRYAAHVAAREAAWDAYYGAANELNEATA
jgi:hypothetical protein